MLATAIIVRCYAWFHFSSSSFLSWYSFIHILERIWKASFSVCRDPLHCRECPGRRVGNAESKVWMKPSPIMYTSTDMARPYCLSCKDLCFMNITRQKEKKSQSAQCSVHLENWEGIIIMWGNGVFEAGWWRSSAAAWSSWLGRCRWCEQPRCGCVETVGKVLEIIFMMEEENKESRVFGIPLRSFHHWKTPRSLSSERRKKKTFCCLCAVLSFTVWPTCSFGVWRRATKRALNCSLSVYI